MRRLIDLQRLRRHLDALPSPEALRDAARGSGNPTPTPLMAETRHTLAAAEYLLEHAGPPSRV